MSPRSAYEILRVPPTASPSEIKASFHRLCLSLHPDKRHGDASGVRELEAVRAAFALLSDPAQRSEHDASLADAAVDPVVYAELDADEVDELPEVDGGRVCECRCGGEFLIREGDELVLCDTCSLAVRVLR